VDPAISPFRRHRWLGSDAFPHSIIPPVILAKGKTLHTLSKNEHPSSSNTAHQATSSSVDFKFPVPATDRIDTWISGVLLPNMARSESDNENSLGDSAYEFVDTDGEVESRDGATESVASADFDGDVASLDEDTEDSEEEDDHPSATTPPGLEDSAELPATTPTISRTSTILNDNERPLIQSIEFEEPYNVLNAETVAAKHTVRDLSEEETEATALRMSLPRVPERMAVTIRQTMTKQGLTTRDPLRILYVGSHSAKQDIIHKIASSVAASVDRGRDGYNSRCSPPSQLYNVVPVSAFGSDETPDIELMHSSGYQINVEDCFGASALKFEDAPERPDVIKLTLDGNLSYHSVPVGESFLVEPQWELPHVAVVYCSDTDDLEARLTMTLVRKFMGRYNIPCIVISHKQLFDRGVCMSLDQHSIHMCLESRDADIRGSVILRRLPIDLSSFLNIDARQMNRNLAFLTGLHEPSVTSSADNTSKRVDTSPPSQQDSEKTLSVFQKCVTLIRTRTRAEWGAILPMAFLFLSVFTTLLLGVPSYGSSPKQAISVNSKVISAMPVSTTSSPINPPVASITATATQVVVDTLTKTATVTQSPGPNSLSVLPSMELGRLFQAPPSKPANKSPICSAETLSEREILIRIPSVTLLSWLNKEALEVNITRGNDLVDTERAYSTGDGVVLLLPQAQAYGLLNISIITTKKPRVNETFQVDFGTSVWQSILDKYAALFIEGKRYSADEIITHLETFVHDARDNSQSTLSKLKAANKLAFLQASTATARVTEIVKAAASDAAKLHSALAKDISAHLVEAESTLAKKLPSLKGFQEPLENGILKAQIQSKLLWLRVQGKHDEYEQYKKRATEATRVKIASSRKCWEISARRGKKAAKSHKLKSRGRGCGKAAHM